MSSLLQQGEILICQVGNNAGQAIPELGLTDAGSGQGFLIDKRGKRLINIQTGKRNLGAHSNIPPNGQLRSITRLNQIGLLNRPVMRWS